MNPIRKLLTIVNKKIFKESTYLSILRLFGIGVSYLFTLIVSRSYGASVLGDFTLCFSILNILTIISLLGNDRAIIKYATIPDKKVSGNYIMNSMFLVATSSVIVATLFYFFAPYLAADVFKKPHLTLPFQVFGISSIFYALGILASETLRGLGSFFNYGIFRFNAQYVVAISLIILSPFLFRATDNYTVYTSFLAGTIISSILAFLLLLTRTRIRLTVKRSLLFNIVKTSYPMLLASSMGLVMQWTSTLVLGVYTSSERLGIYNVATKIAFISSFILMVVNMVVTPRIAEAYHKNNFKRIELISIKISKILALLSIPGFLFLILFAKPVLSLFGNEFLDGESAVIVLLVGQFISTYVGPVANILQMTGHEKKFMISASISMVVNISLNFLLIPFYGIYGAAIATSISLIINNAFCVFFVKHNLGFWPIFVPFKKAHDS